MTTEITNGTRAAMLFCPPLPPLRLGAETRVSIGRHPSCELTLRNDDVSRRHAEVRAEGDRFVLHDLHRPTGTFGNGERVDGSRRLAPGDRIDVGSDQITFCAVDFDAAPIGADAGEAQTVLFDRENPPERRSTFGGDLAEIPASALLQLLEMGSNSGLLEIGSVDGRASIWFEMGRPIHAETEKNLGFDAALSIVALTEGQFRFGPCESEVAATIQANVTELLLEACRLADENEA